MKDIIAIIIITLIVVLCLYFIDSSSIFAFAQPSGWDIAIAAAKNHPKPNKPASGNTGGFPVPQVVPNSVLPGNGAGLSASGQAALFGAALLTGWVQQAKQNGIPWEAPAGQSSVMSMYGDSMSLLPQSYVYDLHKNYIGL